MKLINQQKLLSSILSSDILYFTLRNNKTKNSNFFVNKIKLNQKNNYVLLNIDYFLQNIKQLIRLLQYHFKHHKNFIQIVSSNLMYNEILEQVFKKYGNADNNIKVRKLLNIKYNTKAAIFLGNDSEQKLHSLLLKGFNHNINSILLINSCFEKNVFGNYKIFVDVNNYKKLLFLSVIIMLTQIPQNEK